MVMASERSAVARSDARRQYPHSYLTVFKSIPRPFVFFQQLLTSRKSAIRRLPDSQLELSISATQFSTIGLDLDQSAGKKSLSYCKNLILTNYFITLGKVSCNKNSHFFRFCKFCRFHRGLQFRRPVLPKQENFMLSIKDSV